MRPVERGTIPKDDNGNDVAYSKYQDSRGDLIKRLGDYCSYCEMQLDASLAVEHVQPKKPKGANQVIQSRLLDWNNFLLACTNCNSNKGSTDIVLSDYIWPDKNNTFKAIEYQKGGIVRVSPTVISPLKEKVERLINLVGLTKQPSIEKEASDRRWNKRRIVWDKAERAKDRLQKCNNDYMREQIIETAESDGFWSVWMTVFYQDADMLNRLLSAASYKGTSRQSFDQNGSPLIRVAGEI
ncbi:HNH endonuclease [Photobacterium sanctipauli]|uniref:HNH endonuclease n=1 Tax=Photobacterium sanctipauli TaxID=1342794 RepID=A0A2T3NIC9_9GAMM|nr:HNH endonuclease [Photobacterium sanctipauli]PSW14769.1 HNH endonuclease [Photobacterium sanctipauli]